MNNKLCIQFIIEMILKKKLQESKSSLKAERLKQLLGKQDFHYDMEEVFEPVTENQKKVKTKPS